HDPARTFDDRNLRQDVIVEQVAFEQKIDRAQRQKARSVTIMRTAAEPGRGGKGGVALALGQRVLVNGGGIDHGLGEGADGAAPGRLAVEQGRRSDPSTPAFPGYRLVDDP